jgi:tripartite-type tricarboxylate transporter receptor subunit TctC
MSASTAPNRRKVMRLAAAASAIPHAALSAQTPWPSQPIKLVVPFTPGGSTDVLARVIGQKLEPVLKQPIVIENRPGAGGTIAAGAVAKADPDGYTLMLGHIGVLAFNPSLYPSVPYDSVTSFAPIALIATVPNILAVHPSIPVTTIGEFMAYAKASPDTINYGSGGNGSAAHIATAYFAHAAGLKLKHVPYRGTSPAVNDLIGGHIQMMLTGGPALLPLMAGGQVRALAVSSKARVPFAQDLPTIAETVLPGFEAVQWHGIVAPAKTPDAIVQRLNSEINGLLDTPEVAKTLENEGALALKVTPAAFAAHLKSELDLWRDVIKKSGITIG